MVAAGDALDEQAAEFDYGPGVAVDVTACA